MSERKTTGEQYLTQGAVSMVTAFLAVILVRGEQAPSVVVWFFAVSSVYGRVRVLRFWYVEARERRAARARSAA